MKSQTKSVGDFAEWATRTNHFFEGDFNGDGRTDIALVKVLPGWTTIPVALSDGTGGWTIRNQSSGKFAEWATRPGVFGPSHGPLTGDFNGDGRTDFILTKRTPGWETIPVAFADGNGGWTITNRNAGKFANWLTTSSARIHTGDFNGDGRTDFALLKSFPGWKTMPVALADGNGGWTITNRNAGKFADWATRAGPENSKPLQLVGDFNGDGRTDIALLKTTPGWETIPVAFADGNGGWTITNRNAGKFADWATRAGSGNIKPQPLTGDFNGDGRTDIALLRQTTGWKTMPVALANGNGGWTITNLSIGTFAQWATTTNVNPLIGDFNGDGHSDVALLRINPGWKTVPIVFAH